LEGRELQELHRSPERRKRAWLAPLTGAGFITLAHNQNYSRIDVAKRER
jgi:hypothetical protein